MILLIWVSSSLVSSLFSTIVVTVSVLLFIRRKLYYELFFGFVFLLVLSDNLDHFVFAKSFKNVYIIILFLVFYTDRKNFIPFSPIFKGFLPFLAVAFFALQFSGNPATGLQKSISYVLLLIVVPNYTLTLYRNIGRRLMRDASYFLLLISIVGILVSVVNPNFAYLVGRFRGIFGNPNGEGIFAFLTFAFFYLVNELFSGLFSKNEKRVYYSIIIYVLLICSSRTAMISVLILFMFSKMYRLSPLLGFLLLVTISLSLEYIFSNLPVIISALGLEDYFRIQTLEEGSGRFIAWEFAWERIQNFFFFGGSLGNDEYIMRQHYDLLEKLGHQGGVHNSYLTLWFDVGLVGLLLYFGNMIRLFLQAAKKTKIAFPLFFSVLFSITYESWIAGSLNPFTIILFIVITLVVEPEIVDTPDEQNLVYESLE